MSTILFQLFTTNFIRNWSFSRSISSSRFWIQRIRSVFWRNSGVAVSRITRGRVTHAEKHIWRTNCRSEISIARHTHFHTHARFRRVMGTVLTSRLVTRATTRRWSKDIAIWIWKTCSMLLSVFLVYKKV